MHKVLGEVADLLATRGAARYGREPVSQLEHALQCAALAESEGAKPALVAASLLHDLGHLVAPREATDEPHGRDDVHQYLAMPFLRGVLPIDVLEPVRLHVDAKRYLCQADPEYWNTLSPASKMSLEAQGGRFTPEEALRFVQLPFAADAVRLRLWDDRAKTPGLATPPLAHFVERLEALAIRPG